MESKPRTLKGEEGPQPSCLPSLPHPNPTQEGLRPLLTITIATCTLFSLTTTDSVKAFCLGQGDGLDDLSSPFPPHTALNLTPLTLSHSLCPSGHRSQSMWFSRQPRQGPCALGHQTIEAGVGPGPGKQQCLSLALGEQL